MTSHSQTTIFLPWTAIQKKLIPLQYSSESCEQIPLSPMISDQPDKIVNLFRKINQTDTFVLFIQHNIW